MYVSSVTITDIQTTIDFSIVFIRESDDLMIKSFSKDEILGKITNYYRPYDEGSDVSSASA